VTFGQQDAPREYSIGIEVYGRKPDFDPRVDAIVRVEASRLRGKLREYYDSAGRTDPIRIELPKGSYAPLFKRLEEFPKTASGRGSSPPAERPYVFIVKELRRNNSTY
jgi:hypothetical protein